MPDPTSDVRSASVSCYHGIVLHPLSPWLSTQTLNIEFFPETQIKHPHGTVLYVQRQGTQCVEADHYDWGAESHEGCMRAAPAPASGPSRKKISHETWNVGQGDDSAGRSSCLTSLTFCIWSLEPMWKDRCRQRSMSVIPALPHQGRRRRQKEKKKKLV